MVSNPSCWQTCEEKLMSLFLDPISGHVFEILFAYCKEVSGFGLCHITMHRLVLSSDSLFDIARFHRHLYQRNKAVRISTEACCKTCSHE